MNNFKIYLNESIEMEKSNVHKILKYSEELQKMINPSDTLDDWIKAKLTHAADYLTTVLDYLKYYNEEHQISETKTNNRKNVYFLLKEEYTSEMSIGDLKNIHDKAIELKSFINKFSDLEDWVEAKLTLAGEYLDDVYHHLDYKKLNEINFKKALSTGALFLSTLLPVSADTYLVQKGDTLSKISNVLGISLEDLKKLNPNINPDKLQIGDEIKVPDKITNVYSIEKGDTLTKIAREMNVSLDNLKKLNPNINPDKLQIGQKINLPDIGEEKIEKDNIDKKQELMKSDDSFDDFITAMHQVESNGRLTTNKPILGDNGKARGPLQIWKVYFEDAKQYSNDPIVKNGKYEDVDDLDFSKRVVYQYLRRYANTALKGNDFETLARIHNGGPTGANPKYIKRYNNTGEYWKKLKKHL